MEDSSDIFYKLEIGVFDRKRSDSIKIREFTIFCTEVMREYKLTESISTLVGGYHSGMLEQWIHTQETPKTHLLGEDYGFRVSLF